MKTKKILAVCFSVVILIFIMAACGQDSSSLSSEQSSTIQEASLEPQTVQAATVEESIPTPDAKLGDDTVIGSWIQVDNQEQSINITKNGEKYEYEDNDGKYEATFSSGVLKVKVSDSAAADIYYDKVSGHLFLIYEGSTTEYIK